MFSEIPPIVLASVSPRRRSLLETLGLPFSVQAPGGEEIHPDPGKVASGTMENAFRKAASCLDSLSSPSAILIGADTLVALPDEVLGKPRDRVDAQRMLQQLSGKQHSVVTGVALVSPQFGSRKLAVTTKVTFKTLAPETIAAYLATSEPYDKAGSYAIQGLGCRFIERIEGSHSNTVGLPLESLLDELEAFTGIAAYFWFPRKDGTR